MSAAIAPGAVFRFELAPERSGLGQVIAVEGRVVAVALADVVWDCAPGPPDLETAGWALPHLPLSRAALSGVEWVGEGPAVPEAHQAAHAQWLAQPAAAREVVPAPPAVILRALLG